MIAKKETHVRVQPIANGDGSEDRLLLALEEYSTSVEAGQPLSRESMLAKYSDVADELSNCLDSLEFIREVAPQLGDDAANGSGAVSEIRPRASIGDFQILRELGRGGMGVVYEAEQLSLGRRVALKVLPFAAMLDKQQLARFKNEARAAATLDHPNIVAIYSVGSERGVHYYAMQLVEGQSLAEIIAELKPGRPPSHDESAQAAAVINHATAADTAKAALPTVRATGSAAFSTIPPFASCEYFCTIAGLGIQAAEALDHAHQNGILHRDIKPANLLVDDTGKLWITDFGLARIEKDAGMTMTGNLLGTLRYMSPEQALAKRVVVDHRSDVYSLGVTLYELLTLQPSFTGDERQELLRQIAFEEPRKPRQLNSRIPQDLETIILKSIEKNPGDRYNTARELADDLQRFTSCKPIMARPASVLQRITKWSRRHMALVWTAAAISFVSAGLLACSTALISAAWQEAKRSEDAAQEDLQSARRNLYRANVQIAHYDWAEGRVADVDQMLNEFLPKPGEADLRGWEWYYVRSLCHNEEESTPDLLIPGTSAPNMPYVFAQQGESFLIRRLKSPDISLSLASHNRERFRSSHDGKYLACVSLSGKSDRGVIEIWEPEKRTQRAHIDCDSGISDFAWNPDGHKIVTAQSNNVVNVWNTNDGKKLMEMDGLKGIPDLWNVTWSPDGEFIAVNGNPSNEIAIFKASTGRLVQRLTTHSHWNNDLKFSPDGDQLAIVGGDNTIGIWTVETGALKQRLVAHNGPVNSISWSQDGKRMGSGSADGVIKIWNTSSWEILNTLIGHRDSIESLVWIDGSKTLASRGRDGTKVWKVEKEQRFTSIPAWDAHAWHPSGRQLITWRPEGGKIKIERFDRLTHAIEDLFTIDVEPQAASNNLNSLTRGMDVDPTGQLLAVATTDGTIHVSNLSTKQPTLLIRAHPEQIRSVTWSPNGKMLASGGLHDAFKIWDSATGEKMAQLDAGPAGLAGSTAWSPDGARLATLAWDGGVRLWDTKSWQLIRPLQHDIRNVFVGDGKRGIAWSPKGDRVAARLRGWLVIWDAECGRRLLQVRAHVASTTAVAWSPDGSRIATGSADHTVKIWNADTGEDLLTLSGGDSNGIGALSWSPDGKILTSTGETVKLWDASRAYERDR